MEKNIYFTIAIFTLFIILGGSCSNSSDQTSDVESGESVKPIKDSIENVDTILFISNSEKFENDEISNESDDKFNELIDYSNYEYTPIFKATNWPSDDTIMQKGKKINGIKDGEWEYYIKNGQILEKGRFLNDLPDGKWTRFSSPSNHKIRIQFKNGQRDGKFVKYYESGSIYKEGSFLWDKMDGEWRTYDESSKTILKENYKYGLKDGEHTNYNKNGEVSRVIKYNNGIRTEETDYENGEITYQLKYGDKIDAGKKVRYYFNLAGDTFYIVNGSSYKSEEYQKISDEYNREELNKNESLRRYEEAMNQKKLPNYSSDGQKCSWCNQGIFSHGFCTTCGSASPERTSQTYSRLQDCEMCQGLGIITMSDGKRKICPSCKGKGKAIP